MSDHVLTSAPSTTTVGALPTVNLLPREIAEASQLRRMQLAMVGVVAGAAVIVGALYFHEHQAVSTQQAALSSAQAQNASLQSQQNSLQSVQAVYNQVAAQKALLTQAMAGEVRWSFVLNDLALRIPSNVWITQMQASQTVTGLGTTSSAPTPAAASGASAATAVPGAIGTISFNVTALSNDDLANWLTALAAEKGFANADFSSSNENLIGTRKVVTSSTSVVLTNQVLSNRYTSGN